MEKRYEEENKVYIGSQGSFIHVLSHLLIRTNHHSLLILTNGWLGYLRWCNTKSVAIAEEQDTLAFAFGVCSWFDPLAPSCTLPYAVDETKSTAVDVRAVVAPHDRLDGLSGFVGVIEGNCADVVVKNVSLNDAVEKLTTDKAKFAVNGCSGSANIVPGGSIIVRKRRVCMLKVGDSDWIIISL